MSASTLPLVTVLMPARAAAATIAAAVTSLLAQTYRDWELLVIADDGADYSAVLVEAGISDPRITYLGTMEPGVGPSAARNHGLGKAGGTLVAPLDADDDWAPDRLAGLVPLALRYGVATDNTGVFDVAGRFSHVAFPYPAPRSLKAAAILDCGVPLFPVFRREFAPAGWPDVPFAEDVLFSLQLLDANREYALHPGSLYHYRIRPNSLSHGFDAWRRADAAYDAIIDGLTVNRWSLSPAMREIATAGFAAKQVLNREFGAAFVAGKVRTFQEFLAGRRAHRASA